MGTVLLTPVMEAFKVWWSAESRKGDPARIDQRQAFEAGFRAGTLSAPEPPPAQPKVYCNACDDKGWTRRCPGCGKVAQPAAPAQPEDVDAAILVATSKQGWPAQPEAPARASCDALGLDRPDKYCRMSECEEAEKGRPRCKLFDAHKGHAQCHSGPALIQRVVDGVPMWMCVPCRGVWSQATKLVPTCCPKCGSSNVIAEMAPNGTKGPEA